MRGVRFLPALIGLVVTGAGLVQVLLESDCVHSHVLTWQTACAPIDAGFGTFACGVVLAGAGAVFALVIVPALQRGGADRVRRTGQDAVATVLAIADTGITINGSPEVRLTLRVEPADGGDAYDATVTMWVSRLAIPRPGDQVNVRVDPARPHRVAILPAP